MQGSILSRYIRNAATMAAVTFALSGCLMSEEKTKTEEEILSQHELSGSVGDGPIVGASMRVVRNDGEVLAQFQSGADAAYNEFVRTQGMYYPLTIEARDGVDLVTNQAPDFILIGAVPEAADNTVSNVNPFTTLAVEVARDLPGGITKNNLVTAESTVVAALNNGLSTLAASGPSSTRINPGNVGEIVKASESLAETVRRTRDLQLTFGFPTSGDTVVRAIASDLVDGVVDGRGGPRVDARTSAIATVVAVQVLLESMQNELHVNGQDATAAMNDAIRQVYGTSPDANVDGLTATPEMLDAVNVGLDACLAVDDSVQMQALRQAVDGVQAGMNPMLVRTIVPDDYRQTLGNALFAVAGGSDAVIDTINDVSRDGGDQPAVNRAPNISGTPATLVVAGSTYAFAPGASDPDGDTLTFSISGRPAWASFDSANGSLSGTPGTGDVGSYSNIVITASDGQLSNSLGAFTITVTMNNSAPTISGTPGTSVLVGGNYSFAPIASDADGDALTFSIIGRPSWASFNTSTGRLAGTPGTGDTGSYNNITLSVSDGAASASLPAFSIIVGADNAAPNISGTPPSQLSVGSQYDFTPSVSDPNGDSLTFNIINRPVWATFNTLTGRLSGAPTAGNVGPHNNIVISVTDGGASASLPPFSVIVTDVNSVPNLSGNPPSQVTAGVLYDFTPTASDADGDALTFNVSNLPTWASFDSATGRLSGVPAAGDVGPHNNISISVTDGAASAVLPAFSIIVNLDNSAPSISGTPNIQVSVGESYDFTPASSDSDGDTLTFSVANLPTWASFDTTTGQLSGTPGAGDVGPHNNIVISATDGAASASLPAFAINVTITNSAPTINGTPTSQVVAGGFYDFAPAANDPDGDALVFSIINRPPWASFDTATGRLSGTPGSGDVGAHNNIVISVSDGAASASLAAFSIVVNGTNAAPAISGNPPNQVTLGTQYTFTPAATDTDGDTLTFSVTNRPAWASFDSATGNLSGVPGSADIGIHGNIVISVSDGQAGDSLPPFDITVFVAPNSPPSISGTPPSQVTADDAYSFTPTASDSDGDNLTFSVQNLPVWATFSSSTGRISGTPGGGDVGTYTGISITVSDGSDSASLGPFTITVNAIALGSVTLNWTPPTENEDGTPLMDLAGYRFYWGTTPGSYPNSVTVNNPGLSSYVVDNLAPGTYEFVATSFNDLGVESAYSNPATKSVN